MKTKLFYKTTAIKIYGGEEKRREYKKKKKRNQNAMERKKIFNLIKISTIVNDKNRRWHMHISEVNGEEKTQELPGGSRKIQYRAMFSRQDNQM